MDDFVKQAVRLLLQAIQTGNNEDIASLNDLYVQKYPKRHYDLLFSSPCAFVFNCHPPADFVHYVRGLPEDKRQLIITGITG